jgi:hypothetical protein
MDFDDVWRGLQAEGMFTDPGHRRKAKTKRGWEGGCPTLPLSKRASGASYLHRPQVAFFEASTYYQKGVLI